MPNGEHFDYDVFISYSSGDSAWVRGELLARIEQTGLRAFIDFRDFRRGAPSLTEMERGVRDCRNTLLVLTPDYINSGWCEIETLMLQTRDPANHTLRLLPLLKAKCDKPLRIGALTHIDFTDTADHGLAWRQLFTALGRSPTTEAPAAPEHSGWRLAHPYPMPPHFTGRKAERRLLSDWLNADADHPLLSLRALGGFGKSALAWHWLTHDVVPDAWPRVLWWSFYEGDAGFERFLAEALDCLGENAPPRLSVLDVRRLLKRLEQPGTLLVLDGFERELRAFGGLDAAYRGDAAATADDGRDCLSPLAEAFLRDAATLPNLRAKLLLTTRLCPRILEARGGGLLQGARDEELPQLAPADAVALFGALGIRGTRAEIEAAGAPYGYHPLSLRLLAGLIVADFRQPGDIAVAARLDVSGDLVQRQHHVLETAYDSLTPARRELLGRIACFRGPVRYEALEALAVAATFPPLSKPVLSGVESGDQGGFANNAPPTPRPVCKGGNATAALDAGLRDLIERGLLHHDRKAARFDLHPIVRRYAYDRLPEPDRAAAHGCLRDYFAAVPAPERVVSLEDLAPVIELYHHTVRAGRFDEAIVRFRDRIHDASYYQLGAYRLQIDLLLMLFPDGEGRPPRLTTEGDQAWTLNALANSYGLSGQPRRAVPLFEQHNAIQEKLGNKKNLAIGLGAIASVAFLPIGELRSAEANLRRRIALCRESGDEYWEAVGHQELGRLLAYRGCADESETELATALAMFERQKAVQTQGVTWAYRALAALLRLRADSTAPAPATALAAARRALELADETARTNFPVERDYVRAHWLLGAAHRVAGDTDKAGQHLHEALQRCRHINAVDAEADILIDLARLHAATTNPAEARRRTDEALTLADRCGYGLQAADARLELVKLALAQSDHRAALEHAAAAQRLATCDGPPDHTYRAAYDEAVALLKPL